MSPRGRAGPAAAAAAVVLTGALTAGGVLWQQPRGSPPSDAGCVRTSYDEEVRADAPVAHLRGTVDLLTGRRAGRVTGSPSTVSMPHGAEALRFDGRGEHVRFPSHARYSIATTGQLSVEFWIRPDTLRFPDTEGSGFVYVLGKGAPGEHEWYARMYSRGNEEGRTNRVSGYAFNPGGGLGAGAYVERAASTSHWTQVVLVFDTSRRAGVPLGTVALYADGRRRDVDSLASYDVRPRAGSAPLRIGTGYLGSFFRGSVGDVVVYDHALPPGRVRAHHRAMWRGPCVAGEPSRTVEESPRSAV